MQQNKRKPKLKFPGVGQVIKVPNGYTLSSKPSNQDAFKQRDGNDTLGEIEQKTNSDHYHWI